VPGPDFPGDNGDAAKRTPGRGGAQSPVRQQPNPQATKHESGSGLGFPISNPQQEDMPVSPSNFRREEASAAFGSWT
jgi:hypothetical protein